MKRSSIGKEEDEKSRVKVRAPGLGGEVGSEGDVVRLQEDYGILDSMGQTEYVNVDPSSYHGDDPNEPQKAVQSAVDQESNGDAIISEAKNQFAQTF